MKGAQMEPKYALLAMIFPICSLSGLAAMLRSDQELTPRAILSAVLNSGFFGVVVAGLMVHHFGMESLTLIIAVSILSGLGGTSMVEFGTEALKSYVRKQK